MAMYRDARYIITGLVIFVGLMTFPFWSNAGRAAPAPAPNLDTPAIRQLPSKQCIEATQYMRAYHMQLLNDWRTQVVRDGKEIYVASDGKQYTMSLENTCFQCHSNKAEFCDQCHTYAGVEPDCWSCHIEPKENK
ncbi:hypothetical protein MTCOM_15860 [Moorella thermoacetica]|uniref:Uncharacterized protein n=1 Tax=Neomoorella thermoacetica TaxID=1525 RepID=A0A1J5JMY9_NEOTH|nr:sulfate reduction electron transfer complex DsrMKJOP subunit DsrJ [Moorella thermoacetica]OIQ07923.1 hypothetical protein MOOR_24810 [Moorella thermoacetica]OIQ10922.1 hypothetical protein MOOTH_21000 [Moorella thermoacetica]